jgi:hypothetical protein
MNKYKNHISLIALTGYLLLLFSVTFHVHPYSSDNKVSIYSPKEACYNDPFSSGSGCQLEFFVLNSFSAVIKCQDIIFNNSIFTLTESYKLVFVKPQKLCSFSLRAPPSFS